MSDVNWQIRAAAASMSYAMLNARFGDFYTAGQWHGFAARDLCELYGEEREMFNRGHELLKAMATVIHGMQRAQAL